MSLSRFLSVLLIGALASTAVAQKQDLPVMPKSWEEPLPSGPVNDDYPPSPDQSRQPDVPVGKVFDFQMENSKIFPGTTRKITVYIPSQYKGDKPACVFACLDGLGFGAHVVFDNLIHKGEMPITIGVGIQSGSSVAENKVSRSNRSYEFDGLGDNLARFITEEVFPLVEEKKTPDGLPILLSKDPNDRCTAGGSTGGIGAFTLVWERPDLFRRAYTANATFVCMRGGDRYPILVRKSEPKPIRVFQQDGCHDQWLGGPEVGDWWIGNVNLCRALEFSGTESNHIWGTGNHGSRLAGTAFPDAMRWLWKDWPNPIVADSTRSLNVAMKQVLIPGEGWTVATKEIKKPCDMTANNQGVVFCRDAATGTIYQLNDDGTVKPVIKQAGKGGALAFDKDGKLYAADSEAGKIFVTDSTAAEPAWTEFLDGIKAAQFLIRHNGNLYATDRDAGVVWLVRPDKSKVKVAEGLVAPTGLSVSAEDGTWLAVVESGTHWGTNYSFKEDGTLELGQRYHWYHTPDDTEGLGTGVCCYNHVRQLFTATRLGIAMHAQDGVQRVIFPLPNAPNGRVDATALSFGGTQFKSLYVASNGVIYKRPLNCWGRPGWMPPK